MLAYVFWHRPAAGVEQEAYEQALLRFHNSLARRPPSGYERSVALRAGELPWLAGEGGGYEDWYLIDGWTALGVLEAAAVSHGHVTLHDEAARRAGAGAGAVYRLVEGEGRPQGARLAVWVSRPSGRPDPTIADMLQDGFDASGTALWRRCLALGPAPEFCLLTAEPQLPPASGLTESRLPAGWQAHPSDRRALG